MSNYRAGLWTGLIAGFFWAIWAAGKLLLGRVTDPGSVQTATLELLFGIAVTVATGWQLRRRP